MDPDGPGAPVGDDRGEGGRRGVPVMGVGRCAVRVGQDVAQEPLARAGDQDGAAQGTQLGQSGDQTEIVLRSLGESQARVHDQPLPGNARCHHGLHPGAEFRDDLAHHVPVHRSSVHVVAETPPVHDDEGNTPGSDGRDHARVRQTPADVVDEGRPGVDRARRDRRAHRVDGHEHPLGRERAHDGHDAPQLLLLVDAGGAGPGRLAADVDQVGALRDEIQTVLHRRCRVEPAAAVGEGVRGYVHHPHDGAPVPVRQPGDDASVPVAVRPRYPRGGLDRVHADPSTGGTGRRR